MLFMMANHMYEGFRPEAGGVHIVGVLLREPNPYNARKSWDRRKRRKAQSDVRVWSRAQHSPSISFDYMVMFITANYQQEKSRP